MYLNYNCSVKLVAIFLKVHRKGKKEHLSSKFVPQNWQEIAFFFLRILLQRIFFFKEYYLGSFRLNSEIRNDHF